MGKTKSGKLSKQHQAHAQKPQIFVFFSFPLTKSNHVNKSAFETPQVHRGRPKWCQLRPWLDVLRSGDPDWNA